MVCPSSTFCRSCSDLPSAYLWPGEGPQNWEFLGATGKAGPLVRPPPRRDPGLRLSPLCTSVFQSVKWGNGSPYPRGLLGPGRLSRQVPRRARLTRCSGEPAGHCPPRGRNAAAPGGAGPGLGRRLVSLPMSSSGDPGWRVRERTPSLLRSNGSTTPTGRSAGRPSWAGRWGERDPLPMLPSWAGR